MSTPIKDGSNWKYNGLGGGAGLSHKVTSSDVEEVTTWSESSGEPGIGGFTWIGSPADFKKDFTPA